MLGTATQTRRLDPAPQHIVTHVYEDIRFELSPCIYVRCALASNSLGLSRCVPQEVGAVTGESDRYANIRRDKGSLVSNASGDEQTLEESECLRRPGRLEGLERECRKIWRLSCISRPERRLRGLIWEAGREVSHAEIFESVGSKGRYLPSPSPDLKFLLDTFCMSSSLPGRQF